MKAFPDTSTMERSQDGSEPIRGGSIGLNRILGRFEQYGGRHQRPMFSGMLVSAFTIFRNVWGTVTDHSKPVLEAAFIKDVNLILEYYDVYLTMTGGISRTDNKYPVVIYFPDYHRVAKEIQRELPAKRAELSKAYERFLLDYLSPDALVRTLDHVVCYWCKVGQSTYPHIELARKFREILVRPNIHCTAGDAIALISHIPLDLHIGGRLRGIMSLESYTGDIKLRGQFGTKIDPDGRLPFNSVCHLVFGDKVMIKPMITPKIRKVLLEQAEKEKWVNRGNDEIALKIAKATGIPQRDLRRYDFV